MPASIQQFLTDIGVTHSPLTVFGCLFLALFIAVQIARTAIQRKLLSELMNPFPTVAVTVIALGGLACADHMLGLA